MEEWSEAVNTLGWYAVRYPQADYSGITMSPYMEWHYIQSSIPVVGAFIGPMEEALLKSFLSKLLVEEEVPRKLIKILYLRAKKDRLVVPNPTTMADECQKVYKGCIKRPVESLSTWWPLSSV